MPDAEGSGFEVPLVEGANVVKETATSVLTVDRAPATRTTVVKKGDDGGLLGLQRVGPRPGLGALRPRMLRS